MSLTGPPSIKALLGPTNTGKTHRAVRRMLGHRSGMIGLPLRLLAREVYDRVTAEVGEAKVALITGEERRIPERPRYWVCTTEAMPTDRTVDFVAIDEVQVAAHPERGHVFTDRILHARGARETWLLGAETIAPLLRALLPTLEIDTHPRLSRLRHAGHHRIVGLPPRTAVVAFSVAHVYELAERMRRIHGGTAVVLGALSPRTRNAQVALYQSGEVPVMVATDAIGMGLNMDVHHVAMAGASKFDGREHRDLRADELAQICGRAGRWKRDGTFGTTAGLDAFDPLLVEDLEHHRFSPLRQLWYRNSDLDFSDTTSLQDSLQAAPPRRFLRRIRRADDTDALAALMDHPEVRPLLGGRDSVRQLWRVCQVPDFRKAHFDAHSALLRSILVQLGQRKACLSDDWLSRRVDRLDRVDGDVELLMSRLAFIRTWTFVSHRADWLANPVHWQDRTRDIEDRLSDALHTRLTHRFVDKRTMVLVQGMAGGALQTTVASDGQVRAAGHELGRLVGLEFVLAPGTTPEGAKVARKAARAGLADELRARVQAVVEAPHEAFEVDPNGQICWERAPVGRLAKGVDLLHPQVKVRDFSLVGPGDRSRIGRRLEAWARDLATAVLGPLDADPPSDLSPAARGVLFQLREGLGVLPVRRAEEQLRALTNADRRRLSRLDVRLGSRFVYLAGRFTPAVLAARAALWGAWTRTRPVPAVPGQAPASFPLPDDFPPGLRRALGYLHLGPRAVRVDQAERVAALLRRAARHGPFEAPEEVMAWLGCTREEVTEVVAALGFRPLGADGETPRFSAPHRRRANR